VEYYELKCDNCGHYTNPRKKLIYPNCDNEAIGWVVCGTGNVIKRGTMACPRHTSLRIPQASPPPAAGRTLVHTSGTPKAPTAKRRVIL